MMRRQREFWDNIVTSDRFEGSAERRPTSGSRSDRHKSPEFDTKQVNYNDLPSIEEYESK